MSPDTWEIMIHLFVISTNTRSADVSKYHPTIMCHGYSDQGSLGTVSMPYVTVIVAKQITRVAHQATTAVYRK